MIVDDIDSRIFLEERIPARTTQRQLEPEELCNCACLHNCDDAERFREFEFSFCFMESGGL